MAISVVQSQSVHAQAETTPSLTLPSVTPGNMLLALALGASNVPPSILTTSLGDRFTTIRSLVQANGTVALTAAFVQSALGGDTTVTCATSGPCDFAVGELSGVAVPNPTTRTLSNGLIMTYNYPDMPDSLAYAEGFGAMRGGPIGVTWHKGGMIIALVAVSGQMEITCSEKDWTASGSGSTLGQSYDLRTLNTSGPTSTSIIWMLAAPAPSFYLAFSLPAA